LRTVRLGDTGFVVAAGAVTTVAQRRPFTRETVEGLLQGSRPRARGRAFGRERCFEHQGFWGTVATDCPRLDLALAPRTVNRAADDDFGYSRLERVTVDVAKGAAP
jgi:hypothetical protein